MNPQKALRDLGLNDQETAIYTALFRAGGLPASELAKKVDLRRTTVYAFLKNMSQKGFVSIFVQSGRQLYVAERPQNVAGYFEKKYQNFIDTIPYFESMEKTQTQTTGLRFIDTLDELKRFYAGILREYHRRSYIVMSNGETWKNLDQEYFRQFRKDRNRAGITTQILLTADCRGIAQTNPSPLREIKFLPEQYQFKSSIDIFDDQVLIVGPEQSSLAVVIAVPTMVDIFKSTFTMLWNATPKSKEKHVPPPTQKRMSLPPHQSSLLK